MNTPTSSPDLLRRACRRLIHAPYSLYARWRLRRSVHPSLLGRRFHADPDVFHPTCFLSTPIFIVYLLGLPLSGKRLLDMGTGSGAVGIFASTVGAEVIACDINPRAVALARRNADDNGVGMDIRQSDLFEDLDGECFDYICFNIPYYPKPATTPLEIALNAGEKFETVKRFARDAHSHLRSDGRVVIIFSEDSGYESIMSIFREAGYRVDETLTRRKNFELFHIVAFSIENFSMLRVAYILPSFASGDDDWCIPVIRNFVESVAADVDPVVYALHYPYRRSTYTVHGITVHCLSDGKQSGVNRLQLWRDLIRCVEGDHATIPYDLIHAFWATEIGFFTTRIARRLKLPSVVSLAGGELAGLRPQHYGAQLFPWLRYFVSRSMAGATLLTAGSNWLADMVPQEHRPKLHVLPLGVDTGMFAPAPMRTGRRLIAAASLQPLKDYPTLLNAVAIAITSTPDLTLDIAGYPDPIESERLRRMVKDLGIETSVRFLGEVPHDRMPSLFAEHDLLLHGSLHEAQGMVILEALATGLPVISSRVGIATEISSELVRTFPPGDVGAVARTIIDSLASADHARSAHTAGPALVGSKYSLDDVAAQFLTLYASLNYG